ncbi:MAG: hypothetical protein OXE43_12780 [Chloroflexi bacterium]|nr:hypothetical protein [Chloroflexota bacterium]
MKRVSATGKAAAAAAAAAEPPSLSSREWGGGSRVSGIARGLWWWASGALARRDGASNGNVARSGHGSASDGSCLHLRHDP